ncbi:hypothetical protein F511_09663 [Dorcoceras hygrometricum]|uniref:Uncharacterized protein n=1 Tax=Dorcoceras hygrometricum TaxID=472368 RepID=A0A2Z7AG92_9LAMI|nr:hypothetical protein F511_09663 [Dorcoceras hygrometricum]
MGTGIHQLNLHSVPLGYLKILQVGNADPNNTKAGKQIRGQASVRRAIKTANHATCHNRCYEMHEVIKDRIARPVYQLAINSISLYTRTVYQPGKSSVRDLRSPSAHHSSVVDTRIRYSPLR